MVEFSGKVTATDKTWRLSIWADFLLVFGFTNFKIGQPVFLLVLGFAKYQIVKLVSFSFGFHRVCPGLDETV